MTKAERRLTTTAFICSFIPFIVVVLFIKLLPQDLGLFYDKNINAPLLIGFLCVIPLAIVVGVQFIKSKLLVANSMIGPLVVSILLSASFTFLVFFSIEKKFSEFADVMGGLWKLQSIDYFGVASIVLCLTLAALGGGLRRKKFGDKLSINNRYTKQNPTIFKVVHRLASPIMTVTSAFVAVFISFFSGPLTLLAPFCCLLAFSIWSYVQSYILYKKLVKKAEERTHNE